MCRATEFHADGSTRAQSSVADAHRSCLGKTCERLAGSGSTSSCGNTALVRVSARVDYAVCAALELAAHEGVLMKADELAAAQHIPVSFLENILVDLRRAGVITSQRGREGGHQLARPPDQISVADVIRVEVGNLADIHGLRPEQLTYQGASAHLTDVWVAARAAYRKVLESITLADLLVGDFPPQVQALLDEPDSWQSWPARR
jgi:Rrf2 family protein